jgi:hypothetical protein
MQCAVAEQAIDALDAVLDGNLAVHPRPRLLKVSVLPPLHWSIVLRGCAGSSWPASGVTWSGHAWWGLLRGLVATRETTKPARHALFLNTTLLIRNKRHPFLRGRPQALSPFYYLDVIRRYRTRLYSGIAAKTDTGLVRPHNEDSVAISADSGLAILADGMGGYIAGEVASGIATVALRESLEQRLRRRGRNP